jgi:MoxR-like ATPase
MVADMKPEEPNAQLARQLSALQSQISTIIKGKPDQIRDCLACLIAGGHLLIEDLPGVGKTTLAHALSQRPADPAWCVS